MSHPFSHKYPVLISQLCLNTDVPAGVGTPPFETTPNMALLHSSRLYITLPWLYFTLLDSTLLNHGSTSLYKTLHYSSMAQLHFAYLYHGSTSLYSTLHKSTMALLHSTSLYITLPWLYFNLLNST